MKRTKKMYSLNEIISAYIANVEFAYLENQGGYSFGRLIEEAEDTLYDMCEYEGLNADKVIELADTKFIKMHRTADATSGLLI